MYNAFGSFAILTCFENIYWSIPYQYKEKHYPCI